MKAYWHLVRAQLLLFVRNKNTMIWSFFLPVFMMLALGTFMNDGGDQISLKIGVVDADRTAASAAWKKEIAGFQGVQLEPGSESALMKQLKTGDIDLIVKIKQGFQEAFEAKEPYSGAKMVAIYADPGNQTVTQMATTVVNQAVERFNKERVDYQPVVETEIKPVHSRNLSYMDFLVPGILSLMIMSNNLNGVAATIASWRERGILRRLQGTPLTSSTFIAGQMTARILLNAFQAIVVLLVAYFLFDISVFGSWSTLILLIFLGTLTFMSMGFIVASLSKTPESASPIAGLISFPMIFVGGIFFPIRDLPGILQPLVQAIPIGHLTDALRGVMNDGLTLGQLILPVTVLLAWAVGSFVIAALTFRWDVK
ncbi:ABC transporter permease [Thermoactinomyces mirandus]|uniref:ABC transporter permease n=1 Tax=Thermoactinomyces mirandus TaxID=2756294 RepID=A0A7W1XUL0_9BACL|nr:ABC transporter permease [Thermoactinomyces mirandus]MBA4603347.1 ABC transporter permease [Thermoactinomyces mirandus]